MNIELKKQFQDWIASQVSSGRYTSEIEAIEDTLAEKIEKDEVEYFRERLAQSRKDIAEGRVVEANDEFFDRLRARVEKIAASKSTDASS